MFTLYKFPFCKGHLKIYKYKHKTLFFPLAPVTIYFHWTKKFLNQTQNT